jgi:hypothetical protein
MASVALATGEAGAELPGRSWTPPRAQTFPLPVNFATSAREASAALVAIELVAAVVAELATSVPSSSRRPGGGDTVVADRGCGGGPWGGAWRARPWSANRTGITSSAWRPRRSSAPACCSESAAIPRLVAERRRRR